MRQRIEPALIASMLLFAGATLTAERLAAELQMDPRAVIAKKDDSGISWSELTIARALLAVSAPVPSPSPPPNVPAREGTGTGS